MPGVPLVIVESPFRSLVRPFVTYLDVTSRDPESITLVIIPEYVVSSWWQALLHNQSALRLKGRLLFEPGVMVTSVPWQLTSSADKDMARFDATLARGPQRGPRGVADRPTPTGRQ